MSVFELKPNQELSFQINEGGEPIKVKLRDGLAEVHGTELLVNKTYTFPRTSAVFTYHGATIEVFGQPYKIRVNEKCDFMLCSLKIHGQLERIRSEADQQLTSQNLDMSPICIVLKPDYFKNAGIGKSTLCRILLNYATRCGRAPIFVDLDPDQGHIGLPGTIGALSIESPLDIETGFELRSSMLMHFGHCKPKVDSEVRSDLLYKVLLDNLAKIVHSKLEQDKKSYCSGIIINTPSESEYSLLLHACKAFRANMVLVMDDEVLKDDIKKDLSQCTYPVQVLNVPKTVGIIGRESSYYVNSRTRRIKEYFYGTTDCENLSPTNRDIKFSYIKRLIYQLGNLIVLPDSLMPLGTKPQDNNIKVNHYDCRPSDLLHKILAISYCKIDDVVENPEIVLHTNIMGFICVTNLKGDGDVLSILSPQKIPNPLDHVLLYSEVQYMDSLL